MVLDHEVAAGRRNEDAAVRRNKDAAVRRLLGARVRDLRLRRNLSQATLAERGRTSTKHIGEVERGGCAPTATVLVRIASALGVSVGDLFTTENDAPNQRLRASRRRSN